MNVQQYGGVIGSRKPITPRLNKNIDDDSNQTPQSITDVLPSINRNIIEDEWEFLQSMGATEEQFGQMLEHGLFPPSLGYADSREWFHDEVEYMTTAWLTRDLRQIRFAVSNLIQLREYTGEHIAKHVINILLNSDYQLDRDVISQVVWSAHSARQNDETNTDRQLAEKAVNSFFVSKHLKRRAC